MLTSLAPLASSRRAFRAVAAATFWSIVVGVGIAAAQVGDAWTEFQGGPAKTGAAADGPEPGYRLAWRAPIEPGGPGDRFGLSAPLVAGDFVVAVGGEAVIGVDHATGEQAFTVDRGLGPSGPAAAAASGGRTAIVYTEGWGGGPPPAPGADASPTTSSTPSSGTGNGDVVVDSHLAAFDLGNREPLWPPVRLDGVSRTGVTVYSGAAFVGVNYGTETASRGDRNSRRPSSLRSPRSMGRCWSASRVTMTRSPSSWRSTPAPARNGGATSPRRRRPWSRPSHPPTAASTRSSRASQRHRSSPSTSPTAPSAGADV